MSRSPFALALCVVLSVSGCPSTPAPTDAGAGPDAPTVPCTEECDDGLFCNGMEACEAGACVAGDPPDCDDGVDCTTDACSEERVRCDHVAPDADGDGYGSAACLDPLGDPVGNDCDDASPGRYPGNAEICDDFDIDEDCDPSTFGARDGDADDAPDATCCNGASCGTDCNDSARAIGPDSSEVCNHVDDDCDGNVDETGDSPGFVDADFDGRGDPLRPARGCAGDVGFSVYGDDCNDANIEIRAGQAEICDLRDNDCDGTVDETTSPVLWYPDADGDGFGNPRATAMMSCTPLAGRSILATDCDDANVARSPRAPEICNGLDDDCSGSADFLVAPGDREDDDGDGFADIACSGGTDCNDLDRTVAGGSQEICNGRDDDCDGVRDDACVECTADAHCGAGGLCVGNVCRMICGADGMCAPGQTCCGGACVDTTTNAANCGGCGNRCVLFQSFAACTGGDCTVGACVAPYGDCDGVADNGCEIDTTRSIPHCGGCGRACAPPHAVPRCDARACRIQSCEAGYLDCNGIPDDGCEVFAATDAANCGVCGRACAPGPHVAGTTCTAGTCRVSSCDFGAYDCNLDAADGCEYDLAPPAPTCTNLLDAATSSATVTATAGTPVAALTDGVMCVLPYDYFATSPIIDIDLGAGAHSVSRFTAFFSGSAGTGELYVSTDGTTYSRVALWETYRAFATHDFAAPFTGRYLRLRPFGVSSGSWRIMEIAAWDCAP